MIPCRINFSYEISYYTILSTSSKTFLPCELHVKTNVRKFDILPIDSDPLICPLILWQTTTSRNVRSAALFVGGMFSCSIKANRFIVVFSNRLIKLGISDISVLRYLSNMTSSVYSNACRTLAPPITYAPRLLFMIRNIFLVCDCPRPNHQSIQYVRGLINIDKR